ncbi:MAG: LacI family transcriptional regulator [Synergistaceae bacterium]|nr:LacI family transcriptional regulator [Synergistaceae bacterium]
MAVTIKDIAKKCKVSITTVSRTINGVTEGVGEETRNRVLKAIKDTGYRPNSIARSMITKKTYTVALVIPDICNPFWAELARGVGDACASGGYHLFLCNTDGSSKEEREQVQFLRESRVDGIIFTTQNEEEDNADIKQFIREKYPVVLVERYIKDFKPPLLVTINNRGGIKKLVDYLICRGHKKIAYIGGPKLAANAAMRLEGYREGLAANGIQYKAPLVSAGDYKLGSGYEATVGFLRSQKDNFTAIIAANDLMAIGACGAISDAGLSVPRDISVAGFDNLPLSAMIRPHITSMGVSIHQLGKMAAELLLERLSGVMEERHIFMECALSERNSVRGIKNG